MTTLTDTILPTTRLAAEQDDNAFRAFEFLMTAAAAYWISAAGESGHDVVSGVSRDKPVARLTADQQLEILRRRGDRSAS